VKRLLVVPFLIAAVKAPPVWREDTEAGTRIGAQAETELKARGVSAAATGQVFVSPDNDVLYVTLIARKVSAERDATAREIVDSFLGAPKRAQLTSTNVTVTTSASGIDPSKKRIEAWQRWKNADAEFETESRLLIVADAEHLISITGECLMKASTLASSRDACAAALASLDPELAVDKRVAIALAPEGTEPTPPVATSGSANAPATMSDGSRIPLPPMVVPGVEAKRTVDRRPVYVGAGIVVLAGLFWWSRRRRQRLEAAAAPAPKIKKDTDE
jgi:hypothetical protein